MNLKNYTSTVPASTTLARIESYLAECGVSGIAKQYKEGQPVAVRFQVEMDGKYYTIQLPANIEAVQKTMYDDCLKTHTQPRKSRTLESFREQAVRTAWKIQQDWVQVQMSLIVLKQADWREVFMAYIWDGQQTFYQMLQENNFKALPESTT